jgi:acetyl-CoA C-acetyltransferase
MNLPNQAYISGIYEHPTRKADGISLAQLHADVAIGALEDAGLATRDVDGYFCASEAPGMGPLSVPNYLGFHPRYVESTETGGSSYLILVHHAALAVAMGRCDVALITMGDTQLAEGLPFTLGGVDTRGSPEQPFSGPYRTFPAGMYAMVARRHMYEYGTTSEQLAWVKVAASHHAQYNPHALRREVVTVEDVLNSPLVADPLHRLDCCVVTDGGGAVVITRPEIAKSLKRPLVRVAGASEYVKHNDAGHVDLTYSAGRFSGARAFEEAGCKPSDVKYASLYDSFTITVIMQLEDIGLCKKGEGGKFVADGGLISGVGKLAFNTDGGGLCSNHPGNRGGMTKILEAVRQSRGEAHPKVQVPDHTWVVAHGTGGTLSGDHGGATVILKRE